MKHWFVFFLALASVGTVKGQQTITLSNGNMVAGAYKGSADFPGWYDGKSAYPYQAY